MGIPVQETSRRRLASSSSGENTDMSDINEICGPSGMTTTISDPENAVGAAAIDATECAAARQAMVLPYLVCTGPGTASTLLCDALAGTGVAGWPDEYFVPRSPDADGYWMRRLGITDDADYVDAVVREGMSPNGVFGVKVHWTQAEPFRARLAEAVARSRPELRNASFARLLREKFGATRHVWLRRRNKVAQGIASYRGLDTGVGRSVTDRGDHDSHPGTVEFDFAKIDRAVAMVSHWDQRWDDYFRRHRIAPLMLVYEDMIEKFDLTVRGVLKYLDLPYDSALIAAPDMERQDDHLSRQWEQRYRETKARQAPSPAHRPPATPSARPVAPGSIAPAEGDATNGAPYRTVEGPRRGGAAQVPKDLVAGILNLFQSLGYGAVLVDHEQRVLALNAVAKDCLGDGLMVHGQCVAATDRKSDLGLRRGIGVASKSNDPVVVGLRGRSGQPVLVQIIQFNRVVPDAVSARWLLLITSDPIRSGMRTPPRDVLADVLGLTPAEVSIATGIATGKSLADVATDRGVTTETARVHLKAVFGKTGTRGQAQLAALLARLAVFSGGLE